MKPGSFVTVIWPDGQVGIDGQKQALALVVKVDDAGAVNARVYSPMSSIEWFITGLVPEEQWTTLDGADKNVPYYTPA